MADVLALVERLRNRADCVVEAPAGMPMLANGHVLPDVLTAFYIECGGLRFRSPPMRVVSPSRFLSINQVVLGEHFADDASAAWYLLVESDGSGTAERISIDLRPGFAGRCYDSHWDRHGVAGSMDVVAPSFASFLELLSEQDDWYFWRKPGFVGFGDAYDNG